MYQKFLVILQRFLQARLGKGKGEPDNIPRGGATYERVADARMK